MKIVCQIFPDTKIELNSHLIDGARYKEPDVWIDDG